MATFTIAEAEAQMDGLLDRAVAGEDVRVVDEDGREYRLERITPTARPALDPKV